MEIVIASSNLHKLREMRAQLKRLKEHDFRSLKDFPHYEAPEETGVTFEENALIKGRHAAQSLGRWVISDDSGLVVPALSGLPGVRSARYAGEKASDKQNRKKLLEAMAALKDVQRSAYFECVLSVVSPDGFEKTFSGVCEGVIGTEEKGKNGFGYDSLFTKHDYSQTFAELSEEIKGRISHRGKALEKLLLFLESGKLH